MALQQGLVTITGRVGSTPQGFGHSSPPSICTFRLGCTRGYYDANRQWKSLPTTWITVKTYRALAANVISSVRTGQPVIVVGVLATEEWTADNGDKRSRNVLEASSVGHDLNYGTSHLNQTKRDGAAGGVPGGSVGAAVALPDDASQPPSGPEASSDVSADALSGVPSAVSDAIPPAEEPPADDFGAGDF
ncbi:single-stranded DNA-binding protein [Bifidobacterium sp. 82T10]|uniref:Single-stranded DNA-binding protein n=1 Tax=Bifidobacterium miconis TaxID=2834435 RepID=A0ABS6WE09_9BIFI|nr:single-stranded DNA-binding protein [Bifidobacterium miconis]MBW3091834.1 single-stranded DNA-binding protein [Bifidobacterium miconis]